MKQFTICQVALLVERYDPADFEGVQFFEWHSAVKAQVLPTLKALQHSVEDESLPLHKAEYESFGIYFDSSLIHVDQLGFWFESVGITR